ncbi:NAD-dependent epimerase/dehydratase family protein [uncultured Roseibium sp.]|uniref:NAD-dependent epimerase/dehydratase family protein n=1 Tax=uncultured Roseibium sp. TaxID=1936171 RepID=UPI002592EF25|nr:NAD-dependent epimerase/dehydratase family protein [uncultured Roseibium sp.]
MTDKTALILGATGGSGMAVAQALLARGWKIRALHRHPDDVRSQLPQATWIKGDALDSKTVVAAAEGASLIFHGVNPPGYKNWPRLVLPMLESTLAAARASGARIVLPGTIYNYGVGDGPLLREMTPQKPTTRKGAIRVELEERLRLASERDGVKVLIVRAGDFFGAETKSSWFSQVMVKPGKPLRKLTYPGRASVGHAWAYLPDFAEAIAQLVAMEGGLAPFDRYHFRGYWFEPGVRIAEELRSVAGQPDLPIGSFPWWAIKALSPVVPFFREVSEISVFWKNGLCLDNTKLVARLGSEPHTPLPQALRDTLEGLGCLPVR